LEGVGGRVELLAHAEVLNQEDSPTFRAGTVPGVWEPAYFATVSPRVHVSPRWALAEPAGAPVEASGSLRAVVRSLAPDGRAYWTLDRPLSEARPQALQHPRQHSLIPEVPETVEAGDENPRSRPRVHLSPPAPAANGG
jgi:hypothetical protein